MTDTGKFGSAGDAGMFSCSRCEAAIYDASDSRDEMDSILSAEVRQLMEQHLATCAACSRIYAEARRGQAWLELLKSQRPEPPASLAAKIILQTSGVAPVVAVPVIAGTATVLPMRPRVTLPSFAAIRNVLYQPRLAMTAAMAFFSLTLTLNITGVKLSELKLADLKPGHLQQSFYQADAQVIRYYDNLRLVNEVESSVDQLKGTLNGATTDDQATPDQNAPQQQQQQPDPKGSSERETPRKDHNAQGAPLVGPLNRNEFERNKA